MPIMGNAKGSMWHLLSTQQKHDSYLELSSSGMECLQGLPSSTRSEFWGSVEISTGNRSVQFGTIWKGFLEDRRRGWEPDPGCRGQMEKHGKGRESSRWGMTPDKDRKGAVSSVGGDCDSSHLNTKDSFRIFPHGVACNLTDLWAG